MANKFSYQVLKDDHQKAIIKLTGEFDGSGQESNIARIQANSLFGALNANTVPGLLSQGGSALPYYGLTVHRVWYDTDVNTGIQLFWRANNSPSADASTGIPLLFMQAGGEYDGNSNWITIKNPLVNGNTNGDISLVTKGAINTSTYTIMIELRKDNQYYQRGQFNDPAAFNYPPYGVTP